jgi:hypothetical protein
MLTVGAIKEFLSANGHDPEPEQPFHHYILPPTYGLGAAWKAAREGYSFSEWCSWLENHDIGKTGKPEQPQPVELREVIDKAYTEFQGYSHLANDGHEWGNEVANKFMHIVDMLKAVKVGEYTEKDLFGFVNFADGRYWYTSSWLKTRLKEWKEANK